MMDDEYKALLSMSDKEAAKVLEDMRVHIYGSRMNGKVALAMAYNIALIKAINKLREET